MVLRAAMLAMLTPTKLISRGTGLQVGGEGGTSACVWRRPMGGTLLTFLQEGRGRSIHTCTD